VSPTHNANSGKKGLSAARPSRLLLVAASDREALRRRIRELQRAIEARREPDALMTAEQDGDGPCRLAVIGKDYATLATNLATANRSLENADRHRLRVPAGIYFADSATQPGPTVFLFPGQGSQHFGMLAELRAAFPKVNAWLEALDDAVGDIVRPSTLAIAPESASPDDDQRAMARLLSLDGGAQLAFIAGLALHELLADFGLTADAMLGHSSGEHAALVASGTFVHATRAELFEGAREIMLAARGLPPPAIAESSVAVSACPRTLLNEVIEQTPDLYLAMDNSPSQVVLAGRATAIDAAIERIAGRGAICVRLPFEHAYHTPLFAAWKKRLDELYRGIAAGRGHVPLYSCATAGPYPADPDGARALATGQWATVVRFGDTIERLYDDGYRTFLEVGPGNKLTGLVDDVLRRRPHLAVAACNSVRPDLEQLHHLAGELFVNGFPIDARKFDLRQQQAPIVRTISPAESSDVRSHIVEEHFALMQEFLATEQRLSILLGTAMNDPSRVTSNDDHDSCCPFLFAKKPRVENRGLRLDVERRFDLTGSGALLRDHSLGRAEPAGGRQLHPLPVIPFTLSIEIAAEACRHLFGHRVVVTALTEVRGYRWLALDQGSLTLAIVAEALPDANHASVQLFEIDATDRRLLAFEARAEVAPAYETAAFTNLPAQRAQTKWTARRFYADFAFHGPSFQGIRDVRAINGDSIEAELVVTDVASIAGSSAMAADPALLDCAGQLVGLWLLEQGRRDFGIFPFRLRAFRQYRATPPAGTTIFARAAVRWDDRGATDADIDFFDEHGALLYRLEGFEQRYLPFPPVFAKYLLGTERRRAFLSISISDGQRSLDGLPVSFLEESWGIWSRALAHLFMDRSERRQWYSFANRAEANEDLLARIVAKETVCEFASQFGLDLQAASVAVDFDGGDVRIRCPELDVVGATPGLRIERNENTVTAAIAAPAPVNNLRRTYGHATE
jgi:malonyl CoA-acyl carrier protein transacylase